MNQRLLVLALVALLVAVGGAHSYTVPRDTDILLADGFFKRMRDLFAERAYEDALGGAAGPAEMADEPVSNGEGGAEDPARPNHCVLEARFSHRSSSEAFDVVIIKRKSSFFVERMAFPHL